MDNGEGVAELRLRDRKEKRREERRREEKKRGGEERKVVALGGSAFLYLPSFCLLLLPLSLFFCSSGCHPLCLCLPSFTSLSSLYYFLYLLPLCCCCILPVPFLHLYSLAGMLFCVVRAGVRRNGGSCGGVACKLFLFYSKDLGSSALIFFTSRSWAFYAVRQTLLYTILDSVWDGWACLPKTWAGCHRRQALALLCAPSLQTACAC